MANVQWREIPFFLNAVAPDGDLSVAQPQVAFNPLMLGNDGPQWLVDPDNCQCGAGMRVTRDSVPQSGGDIMHKHFKTGFVFQMAAIAAVIKGAVSGEGGEISGPVCGSDLVDMFDNLMFTLNAMQNVDGNLIWQPTGHPDRAMYSARWLGADGSGGTGFTAVETERDDEIFVGITFALLSPFPYAMDAAQTTTPLGGSSPVTITQGGTVEFFPVIRVFGPTSAFVLHNNTTGELLSYSAAFPGASAIPPGQYIEFDFFRNTAYFNGDGANAKPGIDVLNSDFWSLIPGDNELECDGASADLLWQNAYS